MIEKFVENLNFLNPSRQLHQFPAVNNRKKQPINEEDNELMIKKLKPTDSDPFKLVVSIWETQSTLQMFDYENQSLKIKQYKLNSDQDVFISNYQKRHLKCVITKGNLNHDNILCGTIQRSKGQYFFSPGSKLQAYRVIGSQLKESCRLAAGDVIRIGRMRYFIRQTFDGSNVSYRQFQRVTKTNQLNLESLQSGACKFCLCQYDKQDTDLLISPCNCKGSCAQVHIQCLKQWLGNKVSRKSTSCVDFLNYDNFSCQLCKQDLPIIIKVNGKKYNMLSQQSNSKTPYIILEGIPNTKSSTKNNLTIKINFKEKSSLVIGRGHDTDVRLEDVSISRQHCLLHFKSNQFQLADNKSKFGTLIKIKSSQNVNLCSNKVQISRMTLEMVESERKGKCSKSSQNENKV